MQRDAAASMYNFNRVETQNKPSLTINFITPLCRRVKTSAATKNTLWTNTGGDFVVRIDAKLATCGSLCGYFGSIERTPENKARRAQKGAEGPTQLCCGCKAHRPWHQVIKVHRGEDGNPTGSSLCKQYTKNFSRALRKKCISRALSLGRVLLGAPHGERELIFYKRYYSPLFSFC